MEYAIVFGLLVAAGVAALVWARLTCDFGRCFGCGKEFGSEDDVNFDSSLRPYCRLCWRQRERHG